MVAGKEKQFKKEEKAVQSIVRIAGKDINGALPIGRALVEVKGINISMANAFSYAIEDKLNIKRDINIGSLDDKQINDIEELIKNPESCGIPTFMLNMQKDFDTGKNIHNIGNDLVFSTRQYITRDINLRTWRGYRHQYGQKVRGQHTRSTGRTGITVGVTKKAIEKQSAPPAEGKGKPAKK